MSIPSQLIPNSLILFNLFRKSIQAPSYYSIINLPRIMYYYIFILARLYSILINFSRFSHAYSISLNLLFFITNFLLSHSVSISYSCNINEFLAPINSTSYSYSLTHASMSRSSLLFIVNPSRMCFSFYLSNYLVKI